MSRFKRLRGTFDFNGERDVRGQFQHLYDQLSRRFSGEARLAISRVEDEPNKAVDGKAPPPVLFPVVLTLAERAGANEIARLEKALHDFFSRVIEAAKNLPGPLGAAAAVIGALDELLTKDPAAPAATAMKRIAEAEPATVAWPKVERLIARWIGDDGDQLRSARLSEGDWEAIVEKLRKHDHAAVPAGQQGQNPAPQPPAAPAHPPAAPQEAGPEPDLLLAQLTGWMSKTDSSFEFQIEGRVRFADDNVHYGTWARLDVIGPDGSQLLTSYIDGGRITEWLFDDGDKDVGDVAVTPTSELRRALAEPPPQDKRTASVNGRLWFGNGKPFSARTVAVFVPPRFSRIMSACVAPFEETSQSDDLREVLVAPRALAVTQTDENGYFEFSYAADAAIDQDHALLHVTGLSAPIAVELVDEPARSRTDRGPTASKRFSRPLLVQVDEGLIVPPDADAVDWLDDATDDECGCRGVAFNEPNRAVDEFSFDIVVRTTDPGVVRCSFGEAETGTLRTADGPDTLPEESSLNKYFRTTLSRTERVHWDADPKIAQSVTISHGRVLTLAQTWHADGYSLGDLRYSLPLAPLQKKNIAVLDWDRKDSLRLDSDQEYRESMYNYVGRERDISEIVNSALNETVNGRSESGSSAASAGLGFGLSAVFGGVSGGSSSAWSTSHQDSNRTLAANFINRLRDQTVQAANAVRSQRITTVQQVEQSEHTRAVTETVANRNACHAITVQYFEVLRHFRVEHELVGVRECLFVPLPISPFDEDKALRWRDTLTAYLPRSTLREGLDAIVRQRQGGYPASYAKETLLSLGAEMRVRIDLPFPSGELKDDTDWKAWLGVSLSTPSQIPTLIEKLKRAAPDKRAELWNVAVAPVLASKLVSEWKFSAEADGLKTPMPLEASLASDYQAGSEHRVLVRASADVAATPLVRESVQRIALASPTITGPLTVELTGAKFFVGTEHMSTVVAAGREISAMLTGAPMPLLLPLRPEELRSPAAEDQRKVADLLAHLHANLEYYHKAIWWTMDPDRRFTLLDGYVAPNSGGRSVASVVENRLVAIIGNSIVLPVAPGIRLDYFVDGVASDVGEEGLLAYYRPTIPPKPTRIAVPTKGVFAEAVMGSCNACEKIDNSRNWQYWQHKLPDEPTEIQPVSTDSRARETSVAAKTDMPNTPIINQVVSTLPAAPDPTGLAAALTALVKSGIFPDAAGLAGTQQNAGEALSTTFGTTQRFGELGAELSKKQLQAAIDAMKMVVSAYTGVPIPLGSGGDESNSPSSIRDNVTKDAKAGRISKEQAQATLDRLNNALLDGVSRKSSDPLDHPELSNAIGNAGDRGAPLSVTRGGTKVDIGTPADPPTRSQYRRTSWWGRLLGSEEAEAAEPRGRHGARHAITFEALAAAFPRNPPYGIYGHDEFFDLLGGEWPRLKKEAKFMNTCALRMSYALNVAGLTIPRRFGKPFMDGRGRPLIGDVDTMEKALLAIFGRPDQHVSKAPGADVRFVGQGIVCLRKKFSDATGHVDLWNGTDFLGTGQRQWVIDAPSVKFWRLD